MALGYQDELLVDALRRADTGLYEAWKKAPIDGEISLEISKIQKRLHKLIQMAVAVLQDQGAE